MSVNLSGRSMRKVPLIAHAAYVQSTECDLETFLKAMKKSIEKRKENEYISS